VSAVSHVTSADGDPVRLVRDPADGGVRSGTDDLQPTPHLLSTGMAGYPATVLDAFASLETGWLSSITAAKPPTATLFARSTALRMRSTHAGSGEEMGWLF
jgi:hypothetical protein